MPDRIEFTPSKQIPAVRKAMPLLELGEPAVASTDLLEKLSRNGSPKATFRELKGGALRGVRRQAPRRFRQHEDRRVARVPDAGGAQARAGAREARHALRRARLARDRSLFPEDATTAVPLAPTTLMAARAAAAGKAHAGRRSTSATCASSGRSTARRSGARARGPRSRSRRRLDPRAVPSLAPGAEDDERDRAASARADRGRDPRAAEDRAGELERAGRPRHGRLLRRRREVPAARLPLRGDRDPAAAREREAQAGQPARLRLRAGRPAARGAARARGESGQAAGQPAAAGQPSRREEAAASGRSDGRPLRRSQRQQRLGDERERVLLRAPARLDAVRQPDHVHEQPVLLGRAAPLHDAEEQLHQQRPGRAQ